MISTGGFFFGGSAGGRPVRAPAVRGDLASALCRRVPGRGDAAATGLSAPWDADLACTASTRAVILLVGATGTLSVAIFGPAGRGGAAATIGTFAVGAFADTAGRAGAGACFGGGAASSNVMVVDPMVIRSPGPSIWVLI